MTTGFVFVINKDGRDALRDLLAEFLKPGFEPERYADAAANEATVHVFDGEPEVSVEVAARENIHGTPWTVEVAGLQYFDTLPIDGLTD